MPSCETHGVYELVAYWFRRENSQHTVESPERQWPLAESSSLDCIRTIVSVPSYYKEQLI